MELSPIVARIVRALAGVLVIAGGLVHLKLWDDGYSDIDKIGPAFLLNGLSSIAFGVAVAAWRHWLPVLGALAVVDGSLLAFGLSRTSNGVLDFTERGWNPSPEAALALIFELAAAAALLIVLLLDNERPVAPPRR